MSFHKQDEEKTLMIFIQILMFFHCFWVQLETEKDLKNFSEEIVDYVKGLTLSDREGFFMLCEFAKIYGPLWLQKCGCGMAKTEPLYPVGLTLTCSLCNTTGGSLLSGITFP